MCLSSQAINDAPSSGSDTAALEVTQTCTICTEHPNLDGELAPGCSSTGTAHQPSAKRPVCQKGFPEAEFVCDSLPGLRGLTQRNKGK